MSRSCNTLGEQTRFTKIYTDFSARLVYEKPSSALTLQFADVFGPERKEEWMNSILPTIRSYRLAPMPVMTIWRIMRLSFVG
jgi:hypothetical protein